MNIEICPMSEQHLPGILETERLSFPSPWTENMFRNELKSDKTVYYAAAADGVVCGCCGMWNIAGEGHITNIAVHPDFRKNGIGQKLLGQLIAFARKNKLIFLTLEVRVSNRPAISLYEKNGFSLCGRRKCYYSDNREDALIMTRYFT